MNIPFTKMHGLGNDFMVVDNRQQIMPLDAGTLGELANRKTGIGFDQLLLVENADSDSAAFKYRIYNADGGEVNQCGNGARCFASFVTENELIDSNEFWVETNAGCIFLTVLENSQVRVNMGIPTFSPATIPLARAERQARYSLDFQSQTVSFMAAEIGNPHAVFELGPVSSAPVEALGKFVQTLPLFPERVNAGFMQLLSTTEIDLRVFERGVGETLACGSGACAAVATAILENRLGSSVKVNLLGGSLTIDYAGEGEPIFLTGPTATVFSGELSS
ncbi:MAG: diaminopimelate epimerase [Saprospiraceae bacterium]|jgi:diaminopimelate epimerase